MRDGTDAIADWPLLNALVNTAAGASWVASITAAASASATPSMRAWWWWPTARRRWTPAGTGAHQRSGNRRGPARRRRLPGGHALRRNTRYQAAGCVKLVGRRKRLPHRLRGERHVREDLRDVRIVMTVAVPRPPDTRIQHFSVRTEFLEARTIDPPDIAILRRQGRPSAISPGRSTGTPVRVQPRSVFVRLLTTPSTCTAVRNPGKVPIQESPSLAARMYVAADAVEHHGPLRRGSNSGLPNTAARA